MTKRIRSRVMAAVLALAMLLAAVEPAGALLAQAAPSTVSTKQYTLSYRAGKYTAPLSVTIKAKKGYKVYYTTGKKLVAKQLIASKKSKTLTFKKTTTLRLYGVAAKTKVTSKQLASAKTFKKAKAYKYTLKGKYKKPKGEAAATGYVVSKKAGTYTGSVAVTVSAVKGYDVYYATGSSLTQKQVIPSERSKKFTFSKTATLRLYAAKTTQELSAKQVQAATKKAKAFKYTIQAKAQPNPTPKPAPTPTPKPAPTPAPQPAPSDSGGESEAPPWEGDAGGETFGSETSGELVSDVDAAEKVADVPADQEVTITAEATGGSKDVVVTLPEGAFDEDARVSVRAVDGKVEIKKEGEEAVRLNEPATVQIPMAEKPKSDELEFYKAAYYFGDTTYFIEPDREKLKEGVCEFQVGHFSWFGAAKLTDAEMRQRVARQEAIDEVTLEYKQKKIQEVIDDMAGAIFDELGIESGGKTRSGLTRALGQSTEVYNLVRSMNDGNAQASLQKLSEITINVLCQNPEYLSQTKVNVASSLYSNLPTLFHAVKTGDPGAYKEAATAVLKTFSSNIPLVKYGKAAKALWETGVDWISDYEMDAAYQIFKGEVRDGEHGFVMKNDGSGMDGWNRVYAWMETTLNQRVINYCKESKDKSYMDYTKEEKAEIRQKIWKQTQELFEYRYAQEKEIAKRQAKKESILADLKEEGLLNKFLYGDYCNDDYELLCMRMIKIYEGIEEMLGEENLALLGKWGSRRLAMMGLTREFVEASWVDGQSGLGGREAVAKYMREKYDVDIDEIDVALSKEDIELDGAGSTEEIELVGAGSSSTKWSTNNSAVAKVAVDPNDHNKAVITAVGEGTCRIYAVHNKKDYECWVTVKSAVKAGELTMYVGDKTSVRIPVETSYRDVKVASTGVGMNLSWRVNSGYVNDEYLEMIITAGGQDGKAKCTATVGVDGGKKTFEWDVTVKPVTMTVNILSSTNAKSKEYIFTDSSLDNVVIVDEGNGDPAYLKEDNWGIQVDGMDSPQAEGYSWSIEGDPEAINCDTDVSNWRKDGVSWQTFDHIGDATVKLKLPGYNKTISFTFQVRVNPVIKRKINKTGDISYQYQLEGVAEDADIRWYIESGSDFFDVKKEDGNFFEIVRSERYFEVYNDPEEWNPDYPVVVRAVYEDYDYIVEDESTLGTFK